MKSVSIKISFVCLLISFFFLGNAKPAQAAITFVQSAQAKTSAAVNSLGATFSSNVTAGDTVVVAISTWNFGSTAVVTSVTDSQSNVYTKAVQQGEGSVQEPITIWYHIGVASTGSLTVTPHLTNAGDITVAIHEYSGITSFDQNHSGTGTGTTADSGSTSTTTSANELLFGAFNLDNSGTTTGTAAGGYALRESQTDNSTYEVIYTEDKVVSVTGTYNATMTFPSVTWRAVIATFAGPIGNPASASYKIQSYQFGGGGTAKSTSATYWLNGVAGEVEYGGVGSATFKARTGLTYLQEANVPLAPTLTNPSSYYNKLNLVLATGSNPSDTKFAIAISPDAFASTTKYVQADDTLGTTPIYQTKAVWGSSGFNIIGLSPSTTYTVKVSAIQGNFTQSPYGPTAAVATSNPSFSLSITPNSVSIGALSPGTVITSGTTVTSTISTNGATGGTIYVYDSNAGLLSPSTSYTISAVSIDLSLASEGYGVQGGSPAQSSGGPMEVLAPYNVTTTNVGLLDATKRPIFDSTGAPVTSGTAVMTFKAKAGNTAKAATDYSDTLTIIGAAQF